MKNRYILLISTTLEKLPFFNYLNRLFGYIKNPAIDDSHHTKNQFKNSLLDIINALGLVVVFIGFLILLSSDNQYLNVIKIFNPFYTVLSYLIYGIFFSVIVGTIFTVLSLTRLSNLIAEPKDIFYYVLCHSLRFYAALGFFLGLLIIHAFGSLISEGVPSEEIFQGVFFYIYILVTLVYFPFRLYILPLHHYLKLSTCRVLSVLIIIFIVYIGTKGNELIPPMFSNKLIDNQEICMVYKEGHLYRRISEGFRKNSEEFFCNYPDKNGNKL